MPEPQLRNRDNYDRHRPSISGAMSFHELRGILDADNEMTAESRKQSINNLMLFEKGELPSQQLDQSSGIGAKALDLLRRDWQRQETAQLQRTNTQYRQILGKYESTIQEAPQNPRMNDQLLRRVILGRDAMLERISILNREINDRLPKNIDQDRHFEFPEPSNPAPGAGTMTMSGELPPPDGDDPKKNRLSRLFRRKKDPSAPVSDDSSVSDDSIIPPPTPPSPDSGDKKETKLSDTAREYLMYLDMFPKNSEEISNITRERVAMLNMYAAALDSIKDDPNFESIVTQIRGKFSSTMEQLGLTASPQAMSESWTYEELADAKLLHDSSDKKDTEGGHGHPLTDKSVQDQIASKQLGSEMRSANSKIVEGGTDNAPIMVFAEHESLKNLDKENPNYAEIMTLLQKGYGLENGAVFSDTDSTRLGALIRQNLGEENVSVPDLVPEIVDGNSDDDSDEPKGKRNWLRRRKNGDTEPPNVREKGQPVLGRMWRGEYVSQEEKNKASLAEKTVWKTGTVVAEASRIVGAKTALRLADRWAKRNARMGEVRRIREDVAEEDKLRKKLETTKDESERAKIQERLNELNLGEAETEDTRIQQRINSIRSKIAESKYLSPEKRAALENKLKLLEDKWIAGEAAIQDEMAAEVDTEIENHDTERKKKQENLRRVIMGEISGDLDQNVGERVKKTDYAKETVDILGVVSGAFAIRMGALGAIALGERFKRLQDTKTEGGIVTPKELIVDGARDMALEIIGQGKNKELKGKKKAASIVGAVAKTMLPAMIIFAGASEIGDYGGKVFSKSVEHAGDRVEEIKKAIESISRGGDPGRALLLILNWHEALQRSTMGLYKGTSGYSPDGASFGDVGGTSEGLIDSTELNEKVQVNNTNTVPAGAPTVTAVSGEGVIAPEEIASNSAPTAEDSGILQPKDYATTSETDTLKNGLSDIDTKTDSAEAITPKYDSNIEPKVTAPIGTEQPTPGLATEQKMLNIESSFGVSSADGITPEDVQKVAAQLQGANSESADSLLKSWQEAHPEIAGSVQESRALVELEKALGVNSFEGQVSADEMKKVISELAGEKSADADKLLTAWENKGLVNHDVVQAARFPIEHPSLEHAGFQTETANDKVALSLELGKETAPKYLEQVFYRMGLDNSNIGEEITNVEGARILNVGANMTALSEGHNVAGVSAEDFARHVSIVEGKIVISDYEGFHRDVLDKLTLHAEEIITPENVGNSGAVAYLDNIKNETWADMAKPEGADVNLDQVQIDQAEAREFNDLVHDTGEQTGLDKNITDVHVNDENTGSFNLAGETVVVDHGMISGIGDTHFDPIPLNSDAAHARLMEEASKIEAHRLEESSLGDTDDVKDSSQSSDNVVTGGSGDIEGENKPEAQSDSKTPEQTTEAETEKATAEAAKQLRVEELSKTDQIKMLEKLGFGKGGQGEREWEFLKNKPVADLLNDSIEGHSGNSMDTLEGSHRGKLQKLIKLAIRNGEIAGPSNGGPQKIGAALHQIIEGRVTEQVNQDLHNVTAILATPNLNAAEVAAAVESAEAVNVPTAVPDNVEPIHSVENASGTSVRFDYGADGKIVGVHPHIEDMKSPLTSVNDGYKEMIAQQHAEEGTKLPLASYEVVFENNVRQLEALKQTLETMDTAGNSHTPEADYLRSHIERTTAQLEARFGDVLKDSKGLSSAEIGTSNNNETPSAKTPETPVTPEPDVESVPTESSDKLEDFKTPEGTVAHFQHDNNGNVTGIKVDGAMSGNIDSLQEDFRAKVMHAWEESGKKGDIQFNVKEVEMDARMIDMHRGVLSSLEAAGKGNTPEADFLRQQIENSIERLEKIYGDIFRDSANESAPIIPEITASPQDVKLALENLVTGILSNMDNVSPEVLKGLDGIGLDDIAKINDTTLLENIREGARGVIEEIKANPPSDADPEVLSAVTRGNNAIIEVIDSRLSKLKA